MEFSRAYIYFMVYAFLGWVAEDIYCGIGKRKFVNRGFLMGPYCPIYGFGALLVLYPLLSVGHHPLLVFIAGTILTSALEYVTSYVMEKLFHTRWWDYSTYRFNINGRVCLRNSLMFGVMCLVLVYGIHPFIQGFVESMPLWAQLVFEALFTVVFVSDLVYTVITLLKRKKVMQKLKADAERLKEQFERDRQQALEELNETFDAWLDEHPEAQEAIDRLNVALDRFHDLSKAHLAKAFPERKIPEPFLRMEKLADEIQRRVEEIKQNREGD